MDLKTITQLFESWTPANWIAFSTGAGAIVWNAINSKIGGRREKNNNKREEFDRRVARQIEVALDALWQLREQIEQMRHQRNQDVLNGQFQELAISRSRVNSTLSRALRRASDSEMCSGEDWDNLGSAEFDRVAEYLDGSESAASPQDKDELMVLACRQIEAIDEKVRARIEKELSSYT